MNRVFNILASDNGNKFLCLDCTYGRKRSGRQTELEVFCTQYNFENADRPVKFVVTQCDDYIRANIEPPRAVLKAMQAQAWGVVSSREGKGVVIVPPAEYERRMNE